MAGAQVPSGTDPKLKDIITSLDDDKIDMLAATSVLQHQATDIRSQRVNWQSYLQSQMISQEDYKFIVAFDVQDSGKRENLLKSDRLQCARTFLSLLDHISKDQTLQYILVLVDDMLQEDRTRVGIFHEYALKTKQSAWSPFLNLLNRQDGFITNMTSRVIAKIACWAHTTMERSDLHYYLTWLKDQLTTQFNALAESQLRTDTARMAGLESTETYTAVGLDDGYSLELSVHIH